MALGNRPCSAARRRLHIRLRGDVLPLGQVGQIASLLPWKLSCFLFDGSQVLLDSELSEIRDRERGWAEAMAERGTRTAKWLMSAQKGGE